jgi:hypothetical protein
MFFLCGVAVVNAEIGQVETTESQLSGNATNYALTSFLTLLF